jgi:putative nucleotidyltransferase with HDIG domain
MQVATPVRVSLSEVLSALSHALDLTEGQPSGHTLRTCAIGMRLAAELGLGAADRSALYYALLLKDAGCSSNAARMATLFAADDRVVKPGMKAVDWQRRVRLAVATARHVGAGLPIRARIQQFLAIARETDMTRDLIRTRCDRGASIARQMGFPDATAEAIHGLDEHWNGGGYPDGSRGDAIPLLARIVALAQAVEVFHGAGGPAAAVDVVLERRGTWFDPRLADLVAGWREDRAWWASLHARELTDRVVALEPADQVRWLDADGLDGVSRAFAGIIDAKSPYTYQHSTRVAAFARRIASGLGLDPSDDRRLSRAALLHDIGKLGVSSRILDKAGPLTAPERAAMERHPVYTVEILLRVDAFDDFAWTAALHHEKLDGSGYPWRLAGSHLDLPARVLAVADVYEALTAERPYRAAMTPPAALAILRQDAGTRLSAEAIEALEAAIAGELADGGRGDAGRLDVEVGADPGVAPLASARCGAGS